jgi:hypothetical protein
LTSTARTLSGPFLDVNGDRFMTALDALLIINHLNAGGADQGPGEGEPPLGTLASSSSGAEPAPPFMLPVDEAAHAAHGDNESPPSGLLEDFFTTWPQHEREFLPLALSLNDDAFSWSRGLSFARDEDDLTTALAELFAAMVLDD